MSALLLIACESATQPLPPGSHADATVHDVGSEADAAFDRDAEIHDAIAPDARPISIDGGPGVECTTASQCTTDVDAFRIGACPAAGWSCFAGSCVLECDAGGRDCASAPDGCVECPGETTCPGQPCAIDLSTRPMIEEARCARDYWSSVRQCFGRWIRLDDGTLCAVYPIPTPIPGKVRAVLACGPCQFLLRW
ncbi:MAG: hypothetical protein IT384_06485 [Deltaproteobacteria bacterium]|nr:hypothetical protein [Deltaproteobacteria bacterium]